MKKIFTGVLAALFLCGAGAAYAADTYPVCIDGSEIGRAEAWGGHTFLPMRAIFEACGASVDWFPNSQKIIAHAVNGDYIDMQLGRYSVIVTGNGAELQMGLKNPPYARDGRVYVPVRAVADSLKCKVDWDSANKCVNIESGNMVALGDSALSFNPYLGQVWQGDRLLAEVQVIESAVSNRFYGGTSKTTANGNYLLDLGFIIEGALTSSANQYVWINPKSGEYFELIEAPFWYKATQVLEVGDKIWFSTDNRAVLIDDKVGRVIKEYDLRKYIDDTENTLEVVLAWANEDLALLHERNNTWWGLLDLHTDKVEDITANVLTQELKAEVNERFWQYVGQEGYAVDEEYLSAFWTNIGQSWGSMEPYLELEFVGEKNGVFNFAVKMIAWKSNESGGMDFDVADTVEFSYAYK